MFSAQLTPTITLRWHGPRAEDEATATANEKVKTRGYELLGAFDVPSSVPHSDYLEEVNEAVSIILKLVSAGTTRMQQPLKSGNLTALAKENLMGYAKQKHALTITFN